MDGGPSIVGIVNVTPDSFSDGRRFATAEAAVAQAERLVAEGASMIDIGGQSTRPGYQEISAAEEIARVVPVITALLGRVGVPLSIDTYKLDVARAALEAGAHVLNDIFGLQREPALAQLAAEFGCSVIVMHQEAEFQKLEEDPVVRMGEFFRRSVAIATQAGVPPEQIILDPGIGFGKRHEQNLEILGRLAEIRALGFPVMLGASRKSVIGNVLSLPVEERLEGTLATTALAVWQGIDLIRVHDVRSNLRAARMSWAMRPATY